MPLPGLFFDSDRCSLAAILVADQPVWTALDRLPDHLAGMFREPWPLRGRAGPVERTIVIHGGEVRDDLEVRPAGAKGEMAAFAAGVALEGAAIVMAGAWLFDDRVILGPGTVVEPGALIKGPTVIGARCEVRHGAYVRGDCLVGDGCVVGHTTEIKSAVMLDGAKAGHFAYIGDSILGRDVNLGAGTKLANLKMIPGTVTVRGEGRRHDTGRRKLGAILGDRTETGCNSVTSPGTLIGPDSVVYAAVAVPSGIYPGRTQIRPSRESLLIRGPAPVPTSR